PALRVSVLLIAALGLAGLLGLWRSAHPLIHALSAVGIIAAIAASVWLNAKHYRNPSASDVDRRLAKEAGDSAIIDGLDDRPAGGDLIAHAVWREHQQRLAERAGKIGAGKSKGLLKSLDPWGARWLLLAAFIGCGIYAGREAPARFLESYSPPWGTFLGDGRLTFDVWATPPAYTGQSPIYLAGRAASSGAAPRAPEGSVISVRIFGAKGAPLLVVRSKEGVKRVRFISAGGAFEAKLPIMSDARIEVHRFGQRAHWKIRVQDDKPPAAVFVAIPKAGADSRVAFSWRATDDFGVDKIFLAVRLVNPGPGPESSNRDEIAIPLPSANARSLQANERIDVLAHQFAGLKVEARIVAVDGLGQRGQSKPYTLILPEKKFENPLALAIVEARRTLLRERRQYDAKSVRLFENSLIRLGRAPDGVKRSAKLVDAITLEPAQFFTDASVFLGLKYALGQITNARTIQEAHAAGGTLWAIALKVEYGDRAEAELKLEAARENLKRAIQDGADAKTLDRLASELREAIQEALEARAAEALAKQQPNEPQQQSKDEPQPKMVEQKDIDQMLEEIKDAAKRNDKGEAQRALDKLGQMTDALNPSGEPGEQEQSGQNGEQGKQGSSVEQMQEALAKLGEVMDEQKSLADDTFQKAQEGGGSGDDKMSKEQGNVAGKLAQAAGSTGEKPGSDSLADAGKAMRDAQQAIAQGDFGKAMGLQAQAMNKMRQGQAALAEAAAKANAQKGEGKSEDPLGRQPGMGLNGGKGVNVPDFAERQRSQEILEEIKKRAAKADADPVERSYLERLLERF
ncbi:MAG: DUF4175 family protein, partial [Caulobacterales bacterium]